MDSLTALKVKLPEKQVAWLRQRAEQRGLSVDHVVRALITDAIRGPDRRRREHGLEMGSSNKRSGRPTDDPPPPPEPSTEDPDIMESLRSASKRLQDLTETNGIENTDSGAALSHLKKRLAALGPDNSADAPEETAEDAPTSMFDLMKNDEPSPGA